MNIYQRIVLIVGAVILVMVVFRGEVGAYRYYGDVIEAMVKGVGVVGGTMLIFFALKGIGKK